MFNKDWWLFMLSTVTIQLDLKDLGKVLTTPEPNLDNSPSGVDADFARDVSFAFLETEDDNLQIKVELLKKIVSGRKPQNRSLWIKGDNLENTSSEENDNEWDNLLDDSSGEEEKNTLWYDPTLQRIFNGNLNNFKRARELYKTVQRSSSDNAYFYKLKEKMNHSKKYLTGLQTILKTIMEPTSEDSAHTELQHYEQSTNPVEKNIAIKLITIRFLQMINQIKIQANTDHDTKESILEQYLNGVKDIIDRLSRQIYFGDPNKIGADMENDGSVYKPGPLHSWGVNLSWLLAHLKKGSRFTVISDIITNKTRSTAGASGEHSAFLREICTCLQAGYELKFDGKQTVLYPSSQWNFENCVSNGLSGNGVNPSPDQIEVMFSWLKKGYESRKPFIYSLHANIQLGEQNYSEFLSGQPGSYTMYGNSQNVHHTERASLLSNRPGVENRSCLSWLWDRCCGWCNNPPDNTIRDINDNRPSLRG